MRISWSLSAVVVLVSSTVLVSCGGTDTKTVTEREVRVETKTVTETVVKTVSGDNSPAPQSDVAPAGPSKNTKDTPERSFSGSGEKNIGTLHITVESVLKWTNEPGRLFAMQSADGDTIVSSDSEAGYGDTVVPVGTYRSVRVYGGSEWSFKIVPR